VKVPGARLPAEIKEPMKKGRQLPSFSRACDHPAKAGLAITG
jgi:hypothetical protein